MKEVYYTPNKELVDYLNEFYSDGNVVYPQANSYDQPSDEIVDFKLNGDKLGYLALRYSNNRIGRFPGEYIMCFDYENFGKGTFDYFVLGENEILNYLENKQTKKKKVIRIFKMNISKLRLQKLGDL
jgi:hypothetical protein